MTIFKKSLFDDQKYYMKVNYIQKDYNEAEYLENISEKFNKDIESTRNIKKVPFTKKKIFTNDITKEKHVSYLKIRLFRDKEINTDQINENVFRTLNCSISHNTENGVNRKEDSEHIMHSSNALNLLSINEKENHLENNINSSRENYINMNNKNNFIKNSEKYKLDHQCLDFLEKGIAEGTSKKENLTIDNKIFCKENNNHVNKTFNLKTAKNFISQENEIYNDYIETEKKYESNYYDIIYNENKHYKFVDNTKLSIPLPGKAKAPETIAQENILKCLYLENNSLVANVQNQLHEFYESCEDNFNISIKADKTNTNDNIINNLNLEKTFYDYEYQESQINLNDKKINDFNSAKSEEKKIRPIVLKKFNSLYVSVHSSNHTSNLNIDDDTILKKKNLKKITNQNIYKHSNEIDINKNISNEDNNFSFSPHALKNSNNSDSYFNSSFYKKRNFLFINNPKEKAISDLDTETIDFEVNLEEDEVNIKQNHSLKMEKDLKILEENFEDKNIIKENFEHYICCICDYDLFDCEKEISEKKFIWPKESKIDWDNPDGCCLDEEKLELFKNEENKKIFTLPCKHSFHKICFYGWYKVKKICPVCRYNLDVDFNFPIKNNKLNYFDKDNNFGNIENINMQFKFNKDSNKINSCSTFTNTNKTNVNFNNKYNNPINSIDKNDSFTETTKDFK